MDISYYYLAISSIIAVFLLIKNGKQTAKNAYIRHQQNITTLLTDLEAELHEAKRTKTLLTNRYEKMQAKMEQLPRKIEEKLLEDKHNLQIEHRKNLEVFEHECREKYIVQFKKQKAFNMQSTMIEHVIQGLKTKLYHKNDISKAQGSSYNKKRYATE